LLEQVRPGLRDSADEQCRREREPDDETVEDGDTLAVEHAAPADDIPQHDDEEDRDDQIDSLDQVVHGNLRKGRRSAW
jgi:hypothetical protein